MICRTKYKKKENRLKQFEESLFRCTFLSCAKQSIWQQNTKSSKNQQEATTSIHKKYDRKNVLLFNFDSVTKAKQKKEIFPLQSQSDEEAKKSPTIH